MRVLIALLALTLTCIHPATTQSPLRRVGCNEDCREALAIKAVSDLGASHPTRPVAVPMPELGDDLVRLQLCNQPGRAWHAAVTPWHFYKVTARMWDIDDQHVIQAMSVFVDGPGPEWRVAIGPDDGQVVATEITGQADVAAFNQIMKFVPIFVSDENVAFLVAQFFGRSSRREEVWNEQPLSDATDLEWVALRDFDFRGTTRSQFTAWWGRIPMWVKRAIAIHTTPMEDGFEVESFRYQWRQIYRVRQVIHRYGTVENEVVQPLLTQSRGR